MKPGVLLIVIVFLVVGCFLGWYAQRSYSAHGDVKVTKTRLPNFRRNRNRAGVRTVVIGVIVLLVLLALVHH